MESDTPIHQNELLTPDAPEYFFWLRHARRSQEPVVVLYAGAGRVAVPLAQQEIRVVAVEADEAQRRQGEARSEEAGVLVEWQAGDAESFALRGKAGMMVLAEGSFQRLLTDAAQAAALRRIRDALQVGGKLALALAVPDVQEMARSVTGEGDVLRQERPTVEAESGTLLYRWQSSRYDVGEQRVTTHTIFERVDAEGVTIKRWHRASERAYLWPREVRLLLEGAGFEIEALFGGWNDELLTAASAQQVWVARRGI
jgi:SAM-dependent methyltransferase